MIERKCKSLMATVTQDMKYRQSLMCYAKKYGVSRASRKYNKPRSTIVGRHPLLLTPVVAHMRFLMAKSFRDTNVFRRSKTQLVRQFSVEYVRNMLEWLTVGLYVRNWNHDGVWVALFIRESLLLQKRIKEFCLRRRAFSFLIVSAVMPSVRIQD